MNWKLIPCIPMALMVFSANAADTVTPINVLNDYLKTFEFGKTNEQALEATLQKSGCQLKKDGSYNYSMVKANGEACFGGDKATVSFLAPNNTVDGMIITWNFKNRDDMLAFNKVAEKGLHEKYGVGVGGDSGNMFINGTRFMFGEDIHANLYYDTYGSWSRIELIDVHSTNHKQTLKENITAILKAFPEGKGKVADLDGFAESLGCIVKTSGHNSWLTLWNKLGQDCRNLHIYFKVDPEKKLFSEIKLSPSTKDNQNFDKVQSALDSLLGEPKEVTLKPFNNKASLYTTGNTSVVVTKVKDRGRTNADVVITSKESVAVSK